MFSNINNLRDRIVNTQLSLKIIKFTFVLWSLVALGIFEQHKTQLASQYNDHFLIYSAFWLILTGLGYLLSLFYRANSLDEISGILGKTLSYMIIPISYFLITLASIVLAITSSFDVGILVVLTAVPGSLYAISFWKALRKGLPENTSNGESI